MDRRTAIDLIAKKLDISRDEANTLFDGLRGIMAERCAELDSIAIPGFGTFEPRKKEERIAMHPATGKRILVPPKIVLSFKPSSLLKQKVNSADSADTAADTSTSTLP